MHTAARVAMLRMPSFGIAFAISCLLVILPILTSLHLPLLDSPSHEMRISVLNDILFREVGSPYYDLDTFLLPNIGFDVVGVALVQWLTPSTIARLFFGATMLLTLSGIVVLGRVAHGRWNLPALAASLLIYNLVAILGFLSYGMGMALMFWALAARLALLGRAPSIQFLLGCLMPMVLLMCHASAFAMYAVMLAGIGIDMLARRTAKLLQVIVMGLETVPALLLFALMSTAGEGRPGYDRPFWQNKFFNAAKTLTSGSMAADAAFLLGALAVTLLLVFCCRLRVSGPLVPGVIMLSLLYFVVPSHVSGGSYVDTRIPIVIAMLLLATLDAEMRPRLARLGAGLVVVAAVGFCGKQIALTTSWWQADTTIASIETMLARVPHGAILLQAECNPDATDVRRIYASRQPPLRHVAAGADGASEYFAAIAFAIKGQQPIRTRAAYMPYRHLQDTIPSSVCTQAELALVIERTRAVMSQERKLNMTPPIYLLLLEPLQPNALAGILMPINGIPRFEIYRVDLPAKV
jgi:hypothetical protein